MFDITTSILDPEYGEELDEQRLGEYINAVMDEFADSPEGREFRERYDMYLGDAATYMSYLAQYHGVTPAEASAWETQEVIFELFPRKVSTQPDQAGVIVDELRAFWQFLKRTRDLPQADETLELFNEGAAKRLEAELADESNYGMAKSFVMAGQAAGFDMRTEQGVSEFLAVANSGLMIGNQTEDVDDELDDEEYDPLSVAPIRSETAKVGRNQPCPCGSGRKYKKCCGQRQIERVITDDCPQK